MQKWIQKAVKRMKAKGTVGAFTKQAKQYNMTPKQFANYVLAHKDKFSATTIKRASFAKNANKGR